MKGKDMKGTRVEGEDDEWEGYAGEDHEGGRR